MHVTTICSNVRILTLEQIHTYMNNSLWLNRKWTSIEKKINNLSPNFDNNPLHITTKNFIFYSINNRSHNPLCTKFKISSFNIIVTKHDLTYTTSFWVYSKINKISLCNQNFLTKAMSCLMIFLQKQWVVFKQNTQPKLFIISIESSHAKFKVIQFIFT